jgi:flagellar basal body P-ring formation protein FlgA
MALRLLDVSALMTPISSRHRRGGGRALRLAFAAACLVGLAEATATSAWQDPETIREAAATFARSWLGDRTGVVIEAVAVDDRLRLPQCSQPLSTSVQRALTQGGGTVVVSCGGVEPWRLFVPVRASEQIDVVVVKRGVQRGDVLTATDLDLEARRSSTLPYGYIAQLDEAVGLTVRRTLAAGSVLVPAALEHPRIVERGALVTLTARRGGIVVKSEGVALHAAARNERVRVRTAAGRIVEGVVESADEVRVGGARI